MDFCVNLDKSIMETSLLRAQYPNMHNVQILDISLWAKHFSLEMSAFSPSYHERLNREFISIQTNGKIPTRLWK